VRKPSGVGILVSLLVAAVAVVAVCWPLVGRRQAAAGSSPPPVDETAEEGSWPPHRRPRRGQRGIC
jgi:hypothetical protein